MRKLGESGLSGMSGMKRLRKSSKGQATIEMIIMTPLILFLFLMIVEFSLALRDWIMISNGVREGARYGALGGTIGPDDIRNRVVATSDSIAQPGEVTVAYADPDPSGGGSATDRGGSVVVRTTHDYTFKILNKIIPGTPPSLTLTTCADMRLETATVGAGATGGGDQCDG